MGVLAGSDGIQYSWVHAGNVHFRQGQSLVASHYPPGKVEEIALKH